jgi:hypothetical protein
MNPLDIYLKFPDETTATAAFVKEGVWLTFTDEDKKVCYRDAPDYMTDVIGLIYKPSGVKLKGPSGIESDEMVDIGGWHINMRGELPDTFKPYQVTLVGNPYRIWD